MNKITNLDMFGYKFNLNFNGQHEEHKTFLGGLMSLVIKVLVLWQTYMRFKMMFGYEFDRI